MKRSHSAHFGVSAATGSPAKLAGVEQVDAEGAATWVTGGAAGGVLGPRRGLRGVDGRGDGDVACPPTAWLWVA